MGRNWHGYKVIKMRGLTSKHTVFLKKTELFSCINCLLWIVVIVGIRRADVAVSTRDLLIRKQEQETKII